VLSDALAYSSVRDVAAWTSLSSVYVAYRTRTTDAGIGRHLRHGQTPVENRGAVWNRTCIYRPRTYRLDTQRTPPPPVRVVILDARELHRAALACLLNNRSELKLVGAAADITHAENLASTRDPDIALIGIEQVAEQLPSMVETLRRARAEMGVLLLSGADSNDFAVRALEMGARGVVSERNSPDILVRAIRRVHQGEVWVERRTAARMLSRAMRQPAGAVAGVRALTTREREIVALVGKGLSNRHVSEKLFISDSTVRNHLTSIFRKLEVHNRMELMVAAYRNGLSTPAARFAGIARDEHDAARHEFKPAGPKQDIRHK
jgi:DNA-binding NarL/FixJ family response regulator